MWQEKWYYSANQEKMFKYEILELQAMVFRKSLHHPQYLLINGRKSSDKSCCKTWLIKSHNLDGLIWFDFECCEDDQKSNYLDWSLCTAWSMIDQHLRSSIKGLRSKVHDLRSRFATDLDDLWVSDSMTVFKSTGYSNPSLFWGMVYNWSLLSPQLHLWLHNVFLSPKKWPSALWPHRAQ